MNKKMKKILTVTITGCLAAAMLFSLASCGKSEAQLRKEAVDEALDGLEAGLDALKGNGEETEAVNTSWEDDPDEATWDVSDDCTTLIISGKGQTAMFGKDVKDYKEIQNYRDTLTKIVVKEGVTAVTYPSWDSFDGLEGLPNVTEVQLPSTLKYIGGILDHASGLEHIELPEGIEEIGYTRCSGLKEITFPASIKKIGALAFDQCDNLESVTFLGVPEVIEEEAFDECYNLKTLNHKGFIDVGARAFSCSPIEELVLPDGVKSLGAGCFGGAQITELTVPASLESATIDSFWMPNLKTINFKGTMKQWMGMGLSQELYMNEEDVEWFDEEPQIVHVNFLG